MISAGVDQCPIALIDKDQFRGGAVGTLFAVARATAAGAIARSYVYYSPATCSPPLTKIQMGGSCHAISPDHRSPPGRAGGVRCPASAPLRQKRPVEEERIYG